VQRGLSGAWIGGTPEAVDELHESEGLGVSPKLFLYENNSQQKIHINQ